MASQKYKVPFFALLATTLCLLTFGLIYCLFNPKAVGQPANPKMDSEISKLPSNPSPSVRDLEMRYQCPDGMEIQPGNQSLFPYCMDRFEYPNEKFQLPKTKVSLIEAEKLCQEKGKELCTESQWESACEGTAKWQFSYGARKEKWRCNTDGVKEGAQEFIAPSGSHPGCVNQYGIYDLNGNVSEWVKTEEGTMGVLRGGTAWYSNNYGQSCQSRHEHPRYDSQWPDDGFRCCADAIRKK